MPDLLSISELDKKEIQAILSQAFKMEKLLSRGRPQKALAGKIVSNLFFEPSTRTNSSFQAAAARLGASSIVFYPEKSSSQKGESFEDTIRMMDGYSDCIVVRHPQEGYAKIAADIAEHPVINAGDGGNQHPTQALIDLYTILKIKGKVKGLNVILMGDLKHARAMRSLLQALAIFEAKIMLCSPKALRMDEGIVSDARSRFKADIEETEELDLSRCDVLYVCRVQKERFADQDEAVRMSQKMRLDLKTLLSAPKRAIVLHPLPKLDEIPKEFDSDPRAKYFEQAKNGVPVRMAVLKRCIFGK